MLIVMRIALWFTQTISAETTRNAQYKKHYTHIWTTHSVSADQTKPAAKSALQTSVDEEGGEDTVRRSAKSKCVSHYIGFNGKQLKL